MQPSSTDPSAVNSSDILASPDASLNLAITDLSSPSPSHLPANHASSESGHQHSEGVDHVHSAASRRRIINRVSRIEGHLRGIKTMIQDDRPCPDVLIQIAAVRGGLDRVARIILDEHLSECITRAVDEGNIETEVAALKAALDRFI